MTPLTIVGRNIQQLRQQQAIKQENLAKHLGITKGRMSQIENGQCAELTLHRLEKIAAYLQVGFFDLLKDHTQNGSRRLVIDQQTNQMGYFISTDHIHELAKHISIELKS